MKRIISFLIFILSFFLLASCDLSSYVSDKTPNPPDTEKEEEIEIGEKPAQDDFSKMTNREMEAATEYKMNYKPKDGRNILIAWMRSWSEPNTTEHLGWCGAMTLPRELTLKDNHLYQAPVREINNYLNDKKTFNDITIENDLINLDDFKGTTSKISFEIDVNDMKSGKAGVELYKNSTSKTKVYYDKEKESVVIDRMNSGSLYDGMRYAKINPINGKIKLEIFLDVNSLEVFINDGYYTMTANIYAAKDADNVSLFVENSKAKFINLENIIF
ncbi:MAG: GH32 C-terminal domain-containing protein [Acholeplasmatales bacterium]|nr:GH32 C-terminal domain-containing protein [Acholeplasmatales bacterium]